MLQLGINKGIELEKLSSHETKIGTVLVYIKIHYIHLFGGRKGSQVNTCMAVRERLFESWFSPSAMGVTGIKLVLELTLSGDRHLKLPEPTL